MASFRICQRSASAKFANFGMFSVSSEISAPRTAFISAISNVSAIDMTSPVAFICVPRLRFA